MLLCVLLYWILYEISSRYRDLEKDFKQLRKVIFVKKYITTSYLSEAFLFVVLYCCVGSVHVPQAVNGFGSAPHRSHSVSNVYQSSANMPNGRATGSAFDLVSRPLHLRSVHGSSSVSSTPRPTVHSTPPTKERSRNYQTG